MTNSPEVLWPIPGCRILHNWETNQPYAMPIRALDPAIEQAVIDREDPRGWYQYAIDNESLSYEQKIACIQRAVILAPNYSGWWYTLGCHYELEGKDWYGAANAFNHVIFLNPNSATAWFSLGRLWAARGIMSKAEEAYARFQELEKEKQAPEEAETSREGIPVYPNATEVDFCTVSLEGGGGGVDSTYSTNDPLEKVVEFYERKFGPGDKDTLPGKCRWLFSEVRGNWESVRAVVVEAGPAVTTQAPGAVRSTSIYIGRRDFRTRQA